MATTGIEKTVEKIIFVNRDGTAQILEGEALKKWKGIIESMILSGLDHDEVTENIFKGIETAPVKIQIIKDY